MASQSSHFFSKCFLRSKSQEEEEVERRAYERYKHLISTLPLHTSTQGILSSRKYQGFWFREPFVPGVMAFQEFFKPQENDVLLVTYPKSGTTWLKALAFATLNRHIYSFADHPLLSRHPQDCAAFMEEIFTYGRLPDLDILPSPRLLATHVPYSLLPETIKNYSPDCKIVYLCRDPKDTLVSLWRFIERVRPDVSSQLFPLAFEAFCSGEGLVGAFWDHYLGYWKESLRMPRQVLFLRYEDLKADPEGNLRKIAEFLGMPFTEMEEREGVLEQIVRLCSFEKLSKLEVNKVGARPISAAVKNSFFFRKGQVGGWAELLTPVMAQRLDEITQKMLHGSGLNFPNVAVEALEVDVASSSLPTST